MVLKERSQFIERGEWTGEISCKLCGAINDISDNEIYLGTESIQRVDYYYKCEDCEMYDKLAEGELPFLVESKVNRRYFMDMHCENEVVFIHKMKEYLYIYSPLTCYMAGSGYDAHIIVQIGACYLTFPRNRIGVVFPEEVLVDNCVCCTML